jgi:SGNH hydrolase-like domain, acetyltransferase AlgX
MKLIKHIFFVLFFVLLFSESIQGWLQTKNSFFSITPLHGVQIKEEQPRLTVNSFLSGSFQEQQQAFFEQNLSIRPKLVRIHNQIGYSLFDEVAVKSIVVGKDRVLYDKGYIESYLGGDFIGDELMTKKVDTLAYVQDELKKRNVDLIFLLVPGKASILPQFFPVGYDTIIKKRSNYKALSENLKNQRINYIDFVNYFLKLQPETTYPLFTRCGMHWSSYGSTLAADSLFKYMEKLRNIDLIDYADIGGEESTIPKNTDADLDELLNLMVKTPSYKMYYPNIVFKKEVKKAQPSLLLIGDSFMWDWFFYKPYIQTLFSKQYDFWYYNHEVGVSSSLPNQTLLTRLNLKEQTVHRDFIIVETNEYGLMRPGYGFIKQMYELLQADTLTNNH